MYSPISPSTSMTSPTSPTISSIKPYLTSIQLQAVRSARLVRTILAPPELDDMIRPHTSEFVALESKLDAVCYAASRLSGSTCILPSASPLLQNRILCIAQDACHYLDVVCAELQAWARGGGGGGGDDDDKPLTPASSAPSSRDSDEECEARGFALLDVAEPALPSHMAVALEVMLALLEASGDMLAGLSRTRPAHGVEESKERVRSSLDRARLQYHLYHPEDDHGDDHDDHDDHRRRRLAEADYLGIRSMEHHVSSLTSYLWFDCNSSVF